MKKPHAPTDASTPDPTIQGLLTLVKGVGPEADSTSDPIEDCTILHLNARQLVGRAVEDFYDVLGREKSSKERLRWHPSNPLFDPDQEPA